MAIVEHPKEFRFYHRAGTTQKLCAQSAVESQLAYSAAIDDSFSTYPFAPTFSQTEDECQRSAKRLERFAALMHHHPLQTYSNFSQRKES
jgi:hypothetical protein